MLYEVDCRNYAGFRQSWTMQAIDSLYAVRAVMLQLDAAHREVQGRLAERGHEDGTLRPVVYGVRLVA